MSKLREKSANFNLRLDSQIQTLKAQKNLICKFSAWKNEEFQNLKP